MVDFPKNKAFEAKVARQNYILAMRILNIMKLPGPISSIMDHGDISHPKTINYRYRVQQARKIERDNEKMAIRLDSVRPSPVILMLTRGNYRKTKTRDVKSNNNKRAMPRRDANSGRNVFSPESSDVNGSGGAGGANGSVICEHAKMQDGRRVDSVVVKEFGIDVYSIFGVDASTGQRYQLFVSSEDVASILEADMIVTSLDNTKVWVALLDKVRLEPVDTFVDFYGEVYDRSNRHSSPLHHLSSGDVEDDGECVDANNIPPSSGVESYLQRNADLYLYKQFEYASRISEDIAHENPPASLGKLSSIHSPTRAFDSVDEGPVPYIPVNTRPSIRQSGGMGGRRVLRPAKHAVRGRFTGIGGSPLEPHLEEDESSRLSSVNATPPSTRSRASRITHEDAQADVHEEDYSEEYLGYDDDHLDHIGAYSKSSALSSPERGVEGLGSTQYTEYTEDSDWAEFVGVSGDSEHLSVVAAAVLDGQVERVGMGGNNKVGEETAAIREIAESEENVIAAITERIKRPVEKNPKVRVLSTKRSRARLGADKNVTTSAAAEPSLFSLGQLSGRAPQATMDWFAPNELRAGEAEEEKDGTSKEKISLVPVLKAMSPRLPSYAIPTYSALLSEVIQKVRSPPRTKPKLPQRSSYNIDRLAAAVPTVTAIERIRLRIDKLQQRIDNASKVRGDANPANEVKATAASAASAPPNIAVLERLAVAKHVRSKSPEAAPAGRSGIVKATAVMGRQPEAPPKAGAHLARPPDYWVKLLGADKNEPTPSYRQFTRSSLMYRQQQEQQQSQPQAGWDRKAAPRFAAVELSSPRNEVGVDVTASLAKQTAAAAALLGNTHSAQSAPELAASVQTYVRTVIDVVVAQQKRHASEKRPQADGDSKSILKKGVTMNLAF